MYVGVSNDAAALFWEKKEASDLCSLANIFFPHLGQHLRLTIGSRNNQHFVWNYDNFITIQSDDSSEKCWSKKIPLWWLIMCTLMWHSWIFIRKKIRSSNKHLMFNTEIEKKAFGKYYLEVIWFQKILSGTWAHLLMRKQRYFIKIS